MDTLKQKRFFPDAGGVKLGTFAGVFTPSILTILGIILFLRLGFVIGNAGLGRTLIILLLANGISVLTSLSLSAVATNLKVKGGGDYYLISRTLGLEFGGAIGIVLFLAQSVSIAFYCLGFGEAIAEVLSFELKALPQIIAALSVALLFVFAWLGADWATRFQYVVMSILAAALVSFFFGGLSRWETAILVQNFAAPAGGPGFWPLFAIFFPAVTGFTQGVSMSGDLKDAGKSLPLGTFLAVGVSTIIYFAATVVFAGSLPGEILKVDYGAMKRVAGIGFIIDAGIIAATLSSAMASFLGAPRILQSLAGDRIFPFLLPFAKGSGPALNPRRGVMLSAAIAFAAIGLGNLNVIAPVVAMFFLISYGLLNYATYYEARTASPSFRPRFKWFNSRLSLAGGLMCLGAMLAINRVAGAVAIAVLFAIYQYLQRTAGPARWADSRRSYHLQRVRENLLAAEKEPEHPRDWRPQLLLFSNESGRRQQLLRFASWIEGHSGFATVVRIIEGAGLKIFRQKKEMETELRSEIAESAVEGFPLVVSAPDLLQGVHVVIQAFGIGPLRANTALLNGFEYSQVDACDTQTQHFGQNLKAIFRAGCNIIVLNAKDNEWAALDIRPPEDRRIDVWWWGDGTSRLMLLLAYLMTRSEYWENATIRVLAAKDGDDLDPGKTTEALHHTLEEVRIDAEPEVVIHAGPKTVAAYSADAAMVFLPLRLKGNQPTGPFDSPLQTFLPDLPVAALVLAAEDIDLEAEPEEGRAAEIAAAQDAFADAEKQAKAAEQDADKASGDADEKLNNMLEVLVVKTSEDKLASMRSAALKAKEDAIKAARRAAKAMAKAEGAARRLEQLGVKPAAADIASAAKLNPKKNNHL